MRLFVLAFCALASTLSFAQSGIEEHLLGSWKYDPKSVVITLNAQGQKGLASAGPEGPKRLSAMKAAFGRMMGAATVRFEPNHVFELSMENPKTHAKKVVPGKWAFKNGHVLVTSGNRSPTIDFIVSKDMNHLVNVFNQTTFGEGRITAVKISK